MFIFSSCASKDPHINGTQLRQTMSGNNDLIETTKEFINCNMSIAWETPNFEEHVYASNVMDDSDVTVKTKKNSEENFDSFAFIHGGNLNGKHQEICNEIQSTLTGNGLLTDYRIYQTLAFKQKRISDLSNEFKSVNTGGSLLYNQAYKYIKDSNNKDVIYSVWLPVSVTCENQWKLKYDPDISRAIVGVPEGKCNFILNDYTVELSTGKKLNIFMEGHYQIDSASRNKMMVKIERYGFR